jgi:hypothetical protein
LLLVLIAIGIALRARSGADAARIAAILFLCLAPTLPMARVFETRFALAIWIASAAIACFGFETIRDSRLRVAMLTVTAILALVVNRQQWNREFATSRRMSDEARTFFDLGSGDALRKPIVPGAAMNEFQWLKETHEHRAAGTRWFYDDLYLCTHPSPPRMFEYDARVRMVRQRTDASAIAQSYCSSIRTNAPLSASFHHRDESLFWNLGPYGRGAYAIVMDDGVRTFDVPRSDGFRLPGVTALKFRVRYVSPERWVTYSPELTLDFAKQRDFEWRR